MSFNDKYSDYSEVLDEENNPCTPKSEKSNGQRFSKQSSQLFNTIIWVLHAIVITIYIVGGIQWHRMVPARCFDNHANVPVVWQDQTLRTQFINGSFIDSWGRPNPATDAKWDNLLDVGIIRLTAEEAKNLPLETAPLYHEDGYAGFLEVFHQLHCLNRIRRHFYDPDLDLDDGSSPEFTVHHDEHCFDYIRQNLMCHADLSMLPMKWNAEDQAFVAGFDSTVSKTCRNFDVVDGWARSRKPKYLAPGNGGVILE